jgi:hypothetical protein
LQGQEFKRQAQHDRPRASSNPLVYRHGDRGIASKGHIRTQPTTLDGSGTTQEDSSADASNQENSTASLVAEIFAHQAIQKSILGRAMRLGCVENSKLTKEQLASEIIAYHDSPDTVETHEEKILLDLVYERIVLRTKYSKMLKLLMFFALYSVALLIRPDGTASFEIESRCTIACQKFSWESDAPSPRRAISIRARSLTATRRSFIYSSVMSSLPLNGAGATVLNGGGPGSFAPSRLVAQARSDHRCGRAGQQQPPPCHPLPPTSLHTTPRARAFCMGVPPPAGACWLTRKRTRARASARACARQDRRGSSPPTTTSSYGSTRPWSATYSRPAPLPAAYSRSRIPLSSKCRQH